MSLPLKKTHDSLLLSREDFSDYAKGMLTNMWDYRKEGFLCDVVLTAAKDNKKITAHGLVLSARSKFLKEVFNGKKELIIFDAPGDVVESLVKYCYTGIINVNKDNALLILPPAFFLEFDDVVKACSAVLISTINTENCLPIAKYARLSNCQDLLETAEDYIKKEFEKISLTNQFLKLNQDELEKYLSFDDLNVENEKQVFEAAMKWLDHDLKNRSCAISELLPLIRIQHIDNKYLLDYVLKNHGNEYLSPLLDGIKHFLSYAPLNPKPARTWTKGTGIVFVCTEKIQIYNPKSNVIEFTYDIPVDGFFTPTLLGKKLIIVGNNKKVRCFDLNTKTWHELASMLTGRSMSNVQVLNGFVYVVGGGTNGTRTNTVERWDSKLNRWSQVKEMNYARRGHCSAIVNGKLYVIGGVTNDGYFNSVECYDPIEDSWSVCSPLLTARGFATAVAVNQEIFVFGGWNKISRTLNSIEKYNPERNTWTKVGEMTHKRNRFGAYLLNTKIYLLGGESNYNEWLKSLEEFDPITNECKLIDAPNIEYTKDLYCFPY